MNFKLFKIFNHLKYQVLLLLLLVGYLFLNAIVITAYYHQWMWLILIVLTTIYLGCNVISADLEIKKLLEEKEN